MIPAPTVPSGYLGGMLDFTNGLETHSMSDRRRLMVSFLEISPGTIQVLHKHQASICCMSMGFVIIQCKDPNKGV